MDNPALTVIERYRKEYSAEPNIIARAPGRVNLIGEHVDYTGGYVLPAAIDRDVVIAVGRREDKIITGRSLDFDQTAETTVGMWDRQHPNGWFRYVMGVLSMLEESGKSLGGFQFTLAGNVPIGSGLSSSAAIEMATLTAMEGLFGFKLSGKDAALLCQRAENVFVGMNCGIMDQYISRIGKEDHAILIDCDDLSTKEVPINTPGYTWIIVDSMKRRGLVDSEYNRRRQECETGLATAQQTFPDRGITNLRELSLADLEVLKSRMDPTGFKRVKHVVTEDIRVLTTVEALTAGDIATIEKNLYGSHASLRDDFEVSCAELDQLVEILATVDGVAGARLTGAGFGGCAIAFLRKDAIPAAEAAIRERYRPSSLPPGTKAEVWPVKISDGAGIL